MMDGLVKCAAGPDVSLWPIVLKKFFSVSFEKPKLRERTIQKFGWGVSHQAHSSLYDAVSDMC